MEIRLRPRQVEAINKLYQAMRDGYRRIVFTLPTGAGKSVIAAHLCQVAVQNDRRVLFVTNRRLLVTQMFERAGEYGIDNGVVMAGFSGNSRSPIQIASIQTLHSRYMHDRLGSPTSRELPDADLLIIDEAHQQIEQYVQLMARYPNAKVVGLTATPLASGGLSMIPPYQVLVEGCLNTELINDGLLLKTRMYAPSAPNIEGVKINKNDEYNQSQLGRAVQECTVFADVIKEWMPHFDRKTICFVPGVAYGADMVRQFNSKFGDGFAHLICDKTKQAERYRILEKVRGGSSRILVSVDVLREGFDLPELSCMIDLQPNKQFRSYWQKIGRIKRVFDGQDYAVGLDLAGNSYKFLHPDEDPEWPEGEETYFDVAQKAREKRKDPEPIVCPACGAVRSRGNECVCGHTGWMKVRRIRMGNGKLVEVPIEKKKAIQKTREQVLLDQWKSCLFRFLHSNKSLSQCAAFFQREMRGEAPREGWPGVEKPGSIRWKRRVRDVFTPRKIMQSFDDYRRGKEEGGAV